MRICIYTNTALPKLGGQEIVVDALARQFLDLGHEPVVLAPWRRSQGRFDPASVPYPVVWHPRYVSTQRFVAWYAHWIAKAHHARRFDIVHAHGIYPAGYVATSCQPIAELPLVITSHVDELVQGGLYDRKPGLRARYREALQRSDAVVAISGHTAQRYRQTFADVRQIVPIPNGVNVAELAAVASRPDDLPPTVRAGNYFLFLGRLDRGKGIDLLLEAMAIVGPKCRLDLVVAGGGPEAVALKSQTARLGLADRVHFVGQVTGMKKTWLLQNGLVTIVPSRTAEVFGIVAIESFAAGRPVIASQLPGLADLVHANRTGLLAPPESPQALAEAMLQIAQDPSRADQMGSAARQFVQAFDWRGIALRHIALYEELIAQHQPVAPARAGNRSLACASG
jgi:D-inositol-3-phosphate glycosyltransferase